jgi:hypothetical protein
MMPNHTKTNQTETFYIDSRGFLYLKFSRENNYNSLTVTQLNKYLAFISNICNQTTTSILIDLRGVFGIVSISQPCLRLFAKDIQLKTVCNKIAFITNSLPLSLKINNYITMHHPNIYTKVYNNIEDGIDFCKK